MKNQMVLFKKCIGTHRYFYNKAITEINRRYKSKLDEFMQYPTCIHCDNQKEKDTFNCKVHKKKAIPWKLNITLPSIRNAILKSDSELDDSEKWQKEIPYDTRQLAIKDAVSTYKSATALKVKGIINQFSLKYKKRIAPKQSFWVDHRAIKDGWKIFPSRLKEDSQLNFNKRGFHFLKDKKVEHDVQIMNDRGCWYLVFTYKRRKEEWTKPKYESIALDPGIRTFQTGYSPEGMIVKIGERQIAQVKKLHSKIDVLRSVRSKISKKKTRYHIHTKLGKHQKRIFDIVDNLHNQVVSELTNNFQHIIISPFTTSVMLQSDKLASTTKRMMGTLSFYRFKQKMVAQCQRKGRDLHIESEAYTTKCCGICGNCNAIGGNKVYKCTNCDYEIDRDVHGGRNFFIRYQTCCA